MKIWQRIIVYIELEISLEKMQMPELFIGESKRYKSMETTYLWNT